MRAQGEKPATARRAWATYSALISNPSTRETAGNVSSAAVRNAPVPHVGSRIDAGENPLRATSEQIALASAMGV